MKSLLELERQIPAVEYTLDLSACSDLVMAQQSQPFGQRPAHLAQPWRTPPAPILASTKVRLALGYLCSPFLAWRSPFVSGRVCGSGLALGLGNKSMYQPWDFGALFFFVQRS